MIDEEATFEKFGYYSTEWGPKSHKKVVASCDECCKVRVIDKSQYRALCRSCAAPKGKNSPHWKGGKNMQICEECGIEFPIRPHVVKKRGYGKFCSPQCKGTWQSKHRRGKNSANWKGGVLRRTCEICGTEFPVYPYRIKNGGSKFCSPKCAGKWYTKYRRGENHPNWQGGISFEPYCVKFNNEFKEYIRTKFGRICFLCGKTEEENGRKLSVHHVNYNKNCGCDGDETCQFVPLCVGCNSKVNKNREMWEAKIKAMMKNKLSGWVI